MEELSHLLLVNRGALLCFVEKEELASFRASNRGAVSVFEFEIEEVYCFNEG